MKVYEIKSPQNETYKLFESLLSSAGIVENSQALFFGKKSINETLVTHTQNSIGLILTPKMSLPFLPHNSNLVEYRLEPKLFENLDVFGSRQPILLVKTPQVEPWSASFTGPQLLLPFQEPSNVGAVLRSAAAFGMSKIILAKGCAHPFHPKSSRAASGALFKHQYFSTSSLDKIDFGNLPAIALDRSGQGISEFKFPKDFILVPGVEGPGFPEGFKPTFKVNIPIQNQVESLNAATATAIALYAWSVRVSTL